MWVKFPLLKVHHFSETRPFCSGRKGHCASRYGHVDVSLVPGFPTPVTGFSGRHGDIIEKDEVIVKK